MSQDADALGETRIRSRQALLDARIADGVWEGELSTSALAVATAVFALYTFVENASRAVPPVPSPADTASAGEGTGGTIDAATEKSCRRCVTNGLGWLALHQNSDGGWGDTVVSLSNISTTALCWAAFAADDSRAAPAYASVVTAAEAWLTDYCNDPDRQAPAARDERRRASPIAVGSAPQTTSFGPPEMVRSADPTQSTNNHASPVDPNRVIPAIVARYGKDKTFSVPILTMCALAGRLGEGRDAWRKVPQLPFELAALPQRWFKWMRLPVVSYALPALIAIGLVRHVNRVGWNILARLARTAARRRSLALLERIQPTSGGFLEATPLTSFVVMSLVGAGQAMHPVARRGVEFLLRSARPDGSWPIDTNLATWVTTLSINALAIRPDFLAAMPEDRRRAVHEWLLAQQYRREHPYTLADAGGWAWTPLTGGVPDADDTPGALLALRNLGIIDDRTKQAAAAGIGWLLDLQNRDGGIPTFCRGWGRLPFDRSSADLSAHTLRAIAAWVDDLPADLAMRARNSAARMVEYLILTQQKDGAWLPLWFGNQHAPGDVNPTYGTARVLLAAHAAAQLGISGPAWAQKLAAAVDWLLAAQRANGGWGAGNDTPASIEETALAVEALADILRGGISSGSQRGAADHPLVDLIDYDRVRSAIARGVDWLMISTNRGRDFPPSPIGFYFAKLWYYEKLYPVIFTVAALESALADDALSSPDDPTVLLPLPRNRGRGLG